MSSNRPPALRFILGVVVIDSLALGMTLTTLPTLIESFAHGDPARAANAYGMLGSAFALMQFLFSPVHGELSDRFGRRRVLMMSSFGLIAAYAIMALAPSLAWLCA